MSTNTIIAGHDQPIKLPEPQTFGICGKHYERAAAGGGKVVITALHTGTSRTFSSAKAADRFVDELTAHLERQADHLERQADHQKRIADALEQQNALLAELIAVQRSRPVYIGSETTHSAPLAVQTADGGLRAMAWHEITAAPHNPGCLCDACGGESAA